MQGKDRCGKMVEHRVDIGTMVFGMGAGAQ